jgi:creatinine amidohydrolase/Fe(II)-dependent formamide hydrolase-like protein
MYFSDMFPDELDDIISKKQHGLRKYAFSTAILPVGSVEQHGPHLLLGCDGYITLALAKMTAEKLGGVYFPMLPFSWIGGLRPFAGTIDMRSFVTGDYMENAALEILRQGFDRLMILNSHGGGREMVYSVARRVYKKTKKPVMTMYPSNFWDEWGEEISAFPANESDKLSGALYYLGREDLSDKVIKTTNETLEEIKRAGYNRTAMPGFDEAHTIGEVGHDYNHEYMHAHPKEKIDREKGLKLIEFMSDKLVWGINNY